MRALRPKEIEALVGHLVRVQMNRGEPFWGVFSGASLDAPNIGVAVIRNPRMNHPFKIDTGDTDWVAFPYSDIKEIKDLEPEKWYPS